MADDSSPRRQTRARTAPSGAPLAADLQPGGARPRYGSRPASDRSRLGGRSAQDDAGNPREAWRRAGPYTGYGPSGYRRSDARIRDEVSERLTYTGDVDATDIQVLVSDGEVTLTGLVDNRAAKRAAERVAESVSGVRDVHNQLLLRNNELISRGQGMITGYGELRNGMHVVGSDGQTIGRIKQLRPDGVLVDRPLARDLYVPHDAVQTVSQTWVSLIVPGSQADHQGWAEAGADR